MVHGPGVFVAAIDEDPAAWDDPLSNEVVRHAIEVMRRCKEHELDVVALAFTPSSGTMQPGAVRRLAEIDVAVARNSAHDALQRAHAFATEFLAGGLAAVEDLRRFVEQQRSAHSADSSPGGNKDSP